MSIFLGKKARKNCKNFYLSIYHRRMKELANMKKSRMEESSIHRRHSTLKRACEEENSVIFSNLCENWLEVSRIKNKASTLARYEAVIQNHILPFFSTEEIKDLSSAQINMFIERLLTDKGLSAKSVNDIATILAQILKFGKKNGTIKNLDLNIAKPTVNKKELPVLSLEEQEKLIKAIKDNVTNENIGILLSLFTGMRIGEICALQKKDIDLANGIVSINKTMQRINSKRNGKSGTQIIIDTPKTQRSVRKIPLPEFLLFEIKRLMRDTEENAWLLTGRTDKFTEPRSYQNIFKKYLEKAGVCNTNFHALRHTFATRAVEKGVDVKTLSEILGHSTVSFTMERYVHPSLSIKKSNIEKLSSLY